MLIQAIKDPVARLGELVGIILVTPVIVVTKAKYGLLFVVIWTYLQDLPRYSATLTGLNTDLLDEMVLLLLTAMWLMPMLMKGKPWRRTPIDLPVLLFLIFYVASIFLNSVPFFNALFAFRDVFQYLLLFYFVIQCRLALGLVMKLVDLLFYIGYVQAVVLFGQLAAFWLRSRSFYIEDEATGLMGPGGAHHLGYFAAVLLLLYLGLYVSGYKRKRWPLAVFAWIIVVASVRYLFFAMPIILTVLFAPTFFRSFRNFARWLLVMLIMLIGVMSYVILIPEHSVGIRRPEILIRQQMTMAEGRSSLGRIAFLQYSWGVLNQEASVLIGTGPGTYVSKTASRLGSSLHRQFQIDFPYKNSYPTGSQLSLTLVEYGFLGTILILLIYLIFFLISLPSINALDGESAQILDGLRWAVRGILILYLTSLATQNVFEIQPVSFAVWLALTALTVAHLENRKALRGLNAGTSLT